MTEKTTEPAAAWKPDQWTRQRFKDAWNEGVSVEDLQERFGLTRSQVYSWRYRLDLTPRKVQFDDLGNEIR